jgi:hypothetical protein
MDENMQAVVRVNLHTGELEVRGSEKFVERMLPTARALVELKLSSPPAAPRSVPPAADVSSAASGNGNAAMSLSDFIRDKGLNSATSGEDAMTAFTYYAMKEQKADSVTKEQILELFERAGIPKPNNAASTMSNLKARRGFLQSVGRGAYRLTVQGENFVAHEMGAKA